MKHCPACLQVVPDDARVCPHSGCAKSLLPDPGVNRVAPPPPTKASIVGAAGSLPPPMKMASAPQSNFHGVSVPPPPHPGGVTRLHQTPGPPVSVPPPAITRPIATNAPTSSAAKFESPVTTISPLPLINASHEPTAIPPMNPTHNEPSLALNPVSQGVSKIPALPPLPGRIALTELDRPKLAPTTEPESKVHYSRIVFWWATMIATVLLLGVALWLMKSNSSDTGHQPEGLATSQPASEAGLAVATQPPGESSISVDTVASSGSASPLLTPAPAIDTDAGRRQVDLVFLIDFATDSDKFLSQVAADCLQYAEGLTNHGFDCRFGMLGFASLDGAKVPPPLIPGGAQADFRAALNAQAEPLPKPITAVEALETASQCKFREGALLRFILVSNHQHLGEVLPSSLVKSLKERGITIVVFGNTACREFYAALLLEGGRFHALDKPTAAKLSADENDSPLDRLLRHWSFTESKRAESQMVVAGIYGLRTREDRREWLPELGGTSESEDAVELGLSWLARHQASDGHWGADCLQTGPHFCCQGKQGCPKPGQQYPAAQTGLAVLAFQAGGHFAFNSSRYSGHVGRGLDWIIDRQQANGCLVAGAFGHTAMYEHGIAAFALAEACAVASAAGREPDARLLAATKRAVAFIEKLQHNDGGWRYTTNLNEPSDTSISGWQVLALKSAREAGITVNKPCISKVERFFQSCEGGPTGRTNYSSGQFISEATTGVGMLVHQFLLNRPKSQLVKNAATHLADHAEKTWPPANRQKLVPQSDLYLWYNCTLAMCRFGGEPWKRWNNVVRDTLIKMQERTDGTCLKGSWDDSSNWSASGGRIYSTALAVLTLEVYYRFGHQSPEDLVVDFKSNDPKKRQAAYAAARLANFSLPGEMIAALSDTDGTVRQEARKSLKQQSRGKDYGPDENASAAEQAEAIHHWNEWWEHEKLLPEFSRMNLIQLFSELTHSNLARRWAAAESLRHKKVDSREPIVALFADPSIDVRQAAHRTLVELTNGTDFGPTDPASNDDWAAAGKKWSAWQVAELDKVAAKKFQLAKSLYDGGKHSGASKWLQEIVDQFPNTPTAQRAAELLKQIASKP